MAEQVSVTGSANTTHVVTTPCSGQIVSQVQPSNLQITAAAKPQLMVQTPQQQVLILPPGSTTIPQTQLSQISIRQPTQNNVQLIGQPSVQVVNQPAGPVTVVSQGPATGSQMFYIVSPTRSVTASTPQQALVSGNKVIISAAGTQRTEVSTVNKNAKQLAPAKSAVEVPQPIVTQQRLVAKSPPSISTVSPIVQGSSNITKVIPPTSPSVNSLIGQSSQQTTVVQNQNVVVSQGAPLLTAQASPQKLPAVKVVPKATGNNILGQNQGTGQPVTLQLKITDPSLIQKLGLQQGKGHVLSLSGMNLNQLLASQKVQLVGQSKSQGSASGPVQNTSAQNIKLGGAAPAAGGSQATGNTGLQTVPNLLQKTIVLPQTNSNVVLKTVSSHPVSTTTTVTTTVSTISTSQPQPITVFSNQKGQQQIVMLKQPVSSSQPSQNLSVVGSPPAGTQRLLIQGGQKVSNSIPGGVGASFVIGNRQISNIVPQSSAPTSGVTNLTPLNPVQKRITLSPSSSGIKNTLAVHNQAPAAVVKVPVTPQKVVTVSSAGSLTKSDATVGLSAVSAELKAASESDATASPTAVKGSAGSTVKSVVAASTATPVKPQNTVVVKKTDTSGTTASSSASTVVTSVATPTTTASLGGQASQNLVSKFIRILPPKPGQKQTQMVISVNPNTDVNSEVKKISKELAQLQSQPKTHDTLKKLQDLQTRLQQLQVVTQLIKKAKMGQQNSPGTSAGVPGSASSPTDSKERKKIIKQYKLQEKANRIVAEAVQKAKAAGKVDIPNVNSLELPPIPSGAEEEEEEEKKKKKKDKSRSKSKKSKDSKRKDSKDKKNRDKEKRQQSSSSSSSKKKQSSKKLPAAAVLKLKRQKRKRGEECSDMSDLDETPPRSPVPMYVDQDGEVMQRRSARNTTRKKYTEDYDFKITDDESSSSSDNEGKESSKKSKKKAPAILPAKPAVKKVKQEVEENLDVDVESVEPSAAVQGTQFFVENPDEEEANIIEKILGYRTRKKPQLPGEAQVGEVEEFFVKYRNFSYMHCEWQTVDKIKDPRIHQKVKRFRQKLRHMSPTALQQMEEEPFNPDYIEVDRVLDEAVTKDETSGEEVTHYLVKWCSLPYEDSTWELSSDVLNSKIDFFHKIEKVPPIEQRTRKTKAKSVDWEKLPVSPEYKDNNKLRDYQLEGVNWLTFSWCNGQNCILADEMGLGKTIQSIGFLMEVVKFGIIGPFLVIAPLSTIANWQREVEAWTDMNSVVYHGSAQSRHMIAEFEMFYKDDKGDKIPNCFKFQVLITTYEILLADCQELSEIEWRVVIIDEAHRLKNRNCKLLEGLKILDVEHRVLLTGTPLQNNVEELFSLLNFLEPGRFRSLTQFLDDFGDLKTESQVERLQQLLKPMMLRRLKEDVEKTLAPKEETIIEVELTSIQKRYYRAILERNFSFLQKGANSTSNLPNLMNTMMELRKCCNHPFLINGAEDQIMLEMNPTGQQLHESLLIHLKALIQSSGKMVLLDKLLPKLKEGGHKVLIFSQMIRCLDILEDYLVQKRYLFERIDGRVRGNMRQAAIDRFSKPDSDRFIFLLCTRAGGLGINLTAADTCIIFDSDWNPQNDLQAQARCHRIGQNKAVKVYRLITRNSYEREMFDKASMKLGLDKAVLQSMRADKDAINAQQPLTKTEIEDLLRKGAYGAIMEDDESSSKFCEEDIEMILKRRTKVIQIESGVKGSTFAKASFTVASDHADIKIDDPDFWQKWAKKADITIRDAKEDKIIMAPRQRKQTRRYGGNDMTELSSSDEEVVPKEEKPSKKQLQSGWTRLECFRVEKGLLTFGWGCWEEILATTRFRRRLGEKDIEAISRTMLIYCLQHYKGDENIKSFIWDLVTPGQDGTPKDVKQHKGLSVLVPRGGRKSKKPRKEEPVVPCILEFDFTNKDKNAEQLLTDEGYKNHLKRHCNKVLLRVRLLYYLRHEIIGPMARQIEEGTHASDLNFNIPPPEGEKPIAWWDTKADRSLLVGVYKHGYEKYHLMRLDSCLCFLERCGRPRQDEIMALPADIDVMNDSQLDVDGMEQDTPAIPTVPKHVKEEMESESASPVSTRPSSPATPSTSKRKSASLVPSEPGKLPFPQAPDLNTRVRRLVAGFQREQKKKQLKEAKREKKDQVKKLRMQEQLLLREMRKVEGAQKWSRREESDFYRILVAFGVEQDPVSGEYNWTNFKKLAKLERKYDNRMQEFYEHYRAMCLRVCKREDEIHADFAEKPPLDFQIETISEERASKCLQRIDLLLKVRNQVLTHEHLEERLKLCQKSVELPEWWEPGKHDKDLLLGVSRYGINRMESQQMMMNDPELSFKELKQKYPQMGMPPPGAFTTKPKGEGKKKKKQPAKVPASKADVKAKVDGDATSQTTGEQTVESGAKMMELTRPPLEIKSEPHLDENGALNLSQPHKFGSKDNENTGIDAGTKICQEGKEGLIPRDTKDLQDASQDRQGEEIRNTEVQMEKEVNDNKGVMDNNDTDNNVSKTENGETPAKSASLIKKMSEAEILYTYILRWPKDRVIVHRLEQISVCVLKGMWPGRKHHHHPPPVAVPADPMMLGLDRPPMPLEHSYAGDFLGSKYMEMDEPVPLRKKKKKKKQTFLDPGKPDAASYEVYRLLVGADSQGDREIVKKRLRKDKDGGLEIEGEELDSDGKVKRKRKKEKLKVDPNTGLPIQSEDSQEEAAAAPPPKKRKRLKDPATLRMEDITGEEKVGIIEQATGYVLPAKRVPLLKDVAQWIMKHPRYSIAFEWGEIVIKKRFLPPQLYHRISKTPSAQRAVHFPPYQTRASSSTNPLEASVPLNNLEEMVHVMPASVPLAPSLPIPSREAPSDSLVGKKQKKKSKAKQACIPQPIAPAPASSLPGISPYLIPSTGGVLYSPFLASQGVLQPSANVLMPAQADFAVKSSIITEDNIKSTKMEPDERNDSTVVSQGLLVEKSSEIPGQVEEMDHLGEIDGREEESEDDDDDDNDGDDEKERVRTIQQEYEVTNYESEEDAEEGEVHRSDDEDEDDDDDEQMEEDGGIDSDEVDGEDISDNEEQEEDDDYGEYQVINGGDSDDDDAEPFLEEGEDDDDDDDDDENNGMEDDDDDDDIDEDESAGNQNSDSDKSNIEYNDVDDNSDYAVDDDDDDDE